MTNEELKQAAMEYLKKAFTDYGMTSASPQVVQAAVSIVLAPPK